MPQIIHFHFSLKKMQQQRLECIQGAFGSGKSTRLVERAFAEASTPKRVMIVAPTENHLQDLKVIATSLHAKNSENIVWISAPHLNIIHVNSMDAVLIDDADYPIGYKWSMTSVVKMVHTSRRPLLLLTCRHAETLCANLSITIPAEGIQTLRKSYRLEKIGHAEFIKALFTPKAQQLDLELPEAKVPTLVPKATKAEMATAALNAVDSLHTVILCEDEDMLQTLTRMAPAWNEQRRDKCKNIIPAMKVPTNTNQYFDPCSLQLCTIANFFGRERRHVVAVFPDYQLPLHLFIEAITRHTESLTIVFSSSAPPLQLRNVLWMAKEKDIFVDAAPKRPRVVADNKTIGDLANEIVNETRNLQDALDRVREMFGFSITCGFLQLPNYSTYTGPLLPTNIDRALGSVVEAIILAALGAQRLVDSEVYRKVLATNPPWLMDACDEEEKMWRLVEAVAHLNGQRDVSLTDEFYTCIHQSQFRYFHNIHSYVTSSEQFSNVTNLKPQVSLVLTTLQGQQFYGNADALGQISGDSFVNFILEIKHSLKHLRVSDFAIVQASLYAIAAGATRACAFNAASGSIGRIVLQQQ